MMKLQLSIVFLLLLTPLKAQEYIGVTERSITEAMARDNPGLAQDNIIRNSAFRYLRYTSGNDKETWLIFIDRGGRCNGVRITYSIDMYDEKIKELNEKYRSQGAGTWSYMSGRNTITVRVQRGTWFFTVTHELIHHI
jgi:hypothetical protein